jgi:hypothetical protein
MTNSHPLSVLELPYVSDFVSHLETLLDCLEEVQKFRHWKKNQTVSNHMTLQDKKLHQDAQNAADAVSIDLGKILHPGLGFQDWKLTVKSGAKSMRWARTGSGGRGGADVDSSYPAFLKEELCVWVATNLALRETTPADDRRPAELGLNDQETYLFDIFSYSSISDAELRAPTPTLAYLRAEMLGMLGSNNVFFYDPINISSREIQGLIQQGYEETKNTLNNPETTSRKTYFEWSALPELSLRLKNHPAAKALCPSGFLDVISGQIDREDRQRLAALALSMANLSCAGTPSGHDLKRWVVATSNKNGGKAFLSPDPAGAVMAAAIDALGNGPLPAPSATWRAYPVSASPDASISIPSF